MERVCAPKEMEFPFPSPVVPAHPHRMCLRSRTSTHKIYFDSKLLLIFLGIGDVLFLVGVERRIVRHEYECARSNNITIIQLNVVLDVNRN